MKSLRFLRLSGLNKNTFVKIVYGKNHKFSGYVAENDRKKSLEILNAKGELLVIAYNEIKSFIIKNKANPVEIVGKIPELADEYVIKTKKEKPETEQENLPADDNENEENHPETAADVIAENLPEICQEIIPDSPSEIQSPESAAFFENENYISPPEVDHDYIANLCNCIDDKDVKKIVNRRFNSFMEGIRVHDMEKCASAVKNLYLEYDEYSENENAVRLLAYMYAYIGNYQNACGIFEKINDYLNAAVYGCLSGNYEVSALNSYLCIKSQPQNGVKIREQLIYILINSIIKTDNAFYFSELVKKYSCFDAGTIVTAEDCMDYLLFKKGIDISGTANSKLDKIAENYKIEKHESAADINDFPKDVMFGNIFKVEKLSCIIHPFSNSGKEYQFDRSAVKDAVLTNKLSDSERDWTQVNIAFTSSDGKNAQNIREIFYIPEDMIILGSKYFEIKEYKSALDCFFYAFSKVKADTKEDIFFRIVQCYMSLANSESEIQNYKSAKKFMDKYGSCVINKKYRLKMEYFNIYSKTGESVQMKKYLEMLIDEAEETNQKLHYLRSKAEKLYKEKAFAESIETLNKWIECRHKDTTLESKFNDMEKNIIIPLKEKCQTALDEIKEFKISENNNNREREILEEVKNEINSPKSASEQKSEEKIPENPVKINSDEKKEQLEPKPEFVPISPNDMNITAETVSEVNYSIEPHPERDKNALRNFSAEFNRHIAKKRKDLYIVGSFIISVANMGFFSVRLLRMSLDAELARQNEKSYDAIDFITEFLYSFGVIEKLSIEGDDNEYYFVTSSGMECLNKDAVRKVMRLSSKKLGIMPFEPDNTTETAIYTKHYNIISEVLNTYSRKYFINIYRMNTSYFKTSITMIRKNKTVLGKGKADCAFMLVTPVLYDSYDGELYKSSIKFAMDSLKLRIETGMKSGDKFIVIILSESYGFEWRTILSDAFENIIKDENFYIPAGSGFYSDINDNQLTLADIINIMLSDDEPPQEPENPENPENPEPPEDFDSPEYPEFPEKSEPEIPESEPNNIEDTQQFVEDEEYIKFMNDSSAISLGSEQINTETAEMLKAKKYYCALTYLKAVSKINEDYKPLYDALSMALDNPAENLHYTSSGIFNIPEANNSIDKELYDCCMILSQLRTVYYNDCEYDYLVNSFAEKIKNSKIAQKYPELSSLTDIFSDFRKEFDVGTDCFSDYCMKDKLEVESKIDALKNEIKTFYMSLNATEAFKNPRVKTYKRMMFSESGELKQMLNIAATDDYERYAQAEEFLLENFIKKKADIAPSNISDDKINKYIEKIWNKSDEETKSTDTSNEFDSDTRNNSIVKLKKASSLLCEWVLLVKKSREFSADEKAISKFQSQREDILSILNEIINAADSSDTAADSVLCRTMQDMLARMNGTYDCAMKKYYFIDFLKNNYIILDENGIPDLSSTFYLLPEFNIIERIRRHFYEPERTFEERVSSIFSKIPENNDYGSALFISGYIASENIDAGMSKITEFRSFSKQKTARMRMEFIEDITFSESCGQLYKHDKFIELMKKISGIWYVKCCNNDNYGFYATIIRNLKKLIHDEAEKLKEPFKVRLDRIKSSYYVSESNYYKINSMIEKLNYTVAEDYMNLIVKGEKINADITEENYLDSFWEQYAENYSRCAGSDTLIPRINDKNIYADIISGWISGKENIGEKSIKSLLEMFGFKNCGVKKINEKTFSAELDGHNAALFGSNGFNVLCLSDVQGSDALLLKLHEIGSNADTLILLDYALTETERRQIAREIKRDSHISKAFAVIDRVVITYLAYNYCEDNINKILMSVIMPFSNYQPYVREISDKMPSGLFTGRKEEITSIKSPDGANIIYGARYTGKTELFRMVKREVGDTALLIDIKDCCSEDAIARINNEIDKSESETELIMLDNADVFISEFDSPAEVLKALQDKIKNNIKYVMSAVYGNLGNFAAPELPSLTLKPFSVCEGSELIIKPLSYMGVYFEKPELVSFILASANYYPVLIQQYCSMLIETLSHEDYAGYAVTNCPPYIVTENHIKKVIGDENFRRQVKDKFEEIIRSDEMTGHNYYVLALIIAYLYYTNNSECGYTPEEIREAAEKNFVRKAAQLSVEKLSALLNEMCNLGILIKNQKNNYRFMYSSFCTMMGKQNEIENKLLNYME